MNLKSHPYASFIHEVSKPARYMGGEHFSVSKDWNELAATMVLAFPEVYDIGMSHQGTKILYSIINKEQDLCLERVFCPWFDMEKKLREETLPLVSLETHRPLADFDIVGFSLQYELTFTNILTMLELGRVPLHNRERSLDDPLVVAGGPVASQPEPMANFIDVFLVGDGEERLPRLMRHYTALKRTGQFDRTQILVALAKEGGVYCPELYERDLCTRSGLVHVAKPRYEGVPERVDRAYLDDINRYPYPDESPVPVAEAVFDRMAIEIARGCTEGCRFCQAGMIYRPVRERDPEQVVDTLVSAIEKGGYDEGALTSLSTADYSCISPLVKQVMERLRPKKVALGISSLRAYGLDEDLLDDIASVKATGLTFAPEAGTQRMRDVINKNITEDDIFTTCHRVFSRGWSKIKLYFMIGLPTEEDADVMGISKMGSEALEIGREYQKKKVNVTVSVSSHIPKPHTPFQWCAQDSMEEIERKQLILRTEAKRCGFKLRLHDQRVSYLEALIARGDLRTGEWIERAWRKGARFDGWDEHLRWDVWLETLESWERELGVSRNTFLGTIPIDGRLPWDHIDVGLADGFLAREYRRSLKGRFSPPCGKPVEAKVHHTNLEDARADERKLVCYHCGVACDMTGMREERISFLDKMDAKEPPRPQIRPNRNQNARERVLRGLAPHDFEQGKPHRYRLRYSKTGPMSLRGHLDMIRILPRVFRRAGLALYYTEGFAPRPKLIFGPALALGMHSHAELVDFFLMQDVEECRLLDALSRASEEGLDFVEVRCLPEFEPSLTKRIDAIEYQVSLPEDRCGSYRGRIESFEASDECLVTVTRKHKSRTLDAKPIVLTVELDSPSKLTLRVTESSGTASLRPVEIVKTILGLELLPQAFLRTLVLSKDGRDPMTLTSSRGAEILSPSSF